ncbi:MAG: hypothetical protein HGB18_02995 [Candidatus Moranbacteria bacterium]|nr:hypothetical protein [Candidatus Moranbacteria bacterium]
MTKQELYSLFFRLFREYRTALMADFYEEEKGTKKRVAEAKQIILHNVQKTNRFSYYAFSGLPFSAYKTVSKAVEGEADHIGALNRYLERCAETLSSEVSRIMETRKEPWNIATEIATFRSLSEEYRKLFEGNYPLSASIEPELRSIRRRMIAIYTHPKMGEMARLKFFLLEAIAKPTGYEESTNGLDAALSREAFALLEKLQKALKRTLKKQSKKPR